MPPCLRVNLTTPALAALGKGSIEIIFLSALRVFVFRFVAAGEGVALPAWGRNPATFKAAHLATAEAAGRRLAFCDVHLPPPLLFGCVLLFRQCGGDFGFKGQPICCLLPQNGRDPPDSKDAYSEHPDTKTGRASI
jgi:hypothetical protein